MKKIILFICILIGVSSCDMIAEDIQESKNYFEDKKIRKNQNKIGLELLEKSTEKILWNRMELIIPKNSKINEVNGRLEYDGQALEIEFKYIPNKNNDDICFDVPTSFKEWYKKRNNERYLMYSNNFQSTKSNMRLAEKIAKENGFIECKNGLI